jgi:hypothetical protein
MVVGLLKPDAGSIEIFVRSPTPSSSRRRARTPADEAWAQLPCEGTSRFHAGCQDEWVLLGAHRALFVHGAGGKYFDPDRHFDRVNS